MEEKVSIIVPIYNMENYLKNCIESIIKQSYKNIEIILVDDGSTDESKIICNKYKKIDSRVKLIFSENKGVSNARNLGIEYSIGEYILFVDSDDTIDETYVEEMLGTIKKYKCDVVFCLEKRVYPLKNKIYKTKLKNEEELSTYFDKDFYFIAEKFHTPWGKLYKRDIIKTYDIKFPVNLVTAEDQVFNREYLKYVKTYNYINKNLYNYYIRNNNSISKNISEKYFLSDLKNLRMKKIFLDNELVFVDKKLKNIYLLKYTKFMVRKYLNLKSFNRDELKNIKRRLIMIKNIVLLDDLSVSKINLKGYIYMYFLKKNIWMGIYIIVFAVYIKNLWRK